MVMRSYQTEINRINKTNQELILRERMMQESIDNYKNMERVDTAPHDAPKRRTKSKDLKKSKTKGPFESVKSRLF